MNSYKVSSKTQTTGWDPETNDINGVNTQNMTPVQVAAQAGHIDDMKAILENPDFDPKTAQNMGVYFEICRQDNPMRYKKVGEIFREKLKFDSETNQWARKTPVDLELANMDLGEKIEYNRKKMGLSPDDLSVKPNSPSPFNKA